MSERYSTSADFRCWRVEIGIARAHRQAIRLTHDRTDHNLHRNIQIAHHAANDRRLGGIFLPEEGPVRLHDVEKL